MGKLGSWGYFKTNKNLRKGSSWSGGDQNRQRHQMHVRRLKFAKMKQAMEAQKENKSCR